MAFVDTLAYKLGFSGPQVLSFFENRWTGIQSWLNRIDYDNMSQAEKDELKAVYANVISDLLRYKSVKNCGGVRGLSLRYNVEEPVINDMLEDFENELCPLYEATLE